MAFDTPFYARRLEQAGVPDGQAKTMADATRELAVSNFVTKEILPRSTSASWPQWKPKACGTRYAWAG
jgi:hypothetical protein